MSKSTKEMLEEQYEQVIEQLAQQLIQFAILRNNPKLMQSTQRFAEYSIEMLIQERDRIQQGLKILENSDDPEDEIKALMVANTGYAETVH